MVHQPKSQPNWFRLGVVVLVCLLVLGLVGYVSHALDIVALIRAVGLIGVTAIIFAESGLFIGFFLPGDSLLFTAGILASQDILDIRWLVPLCYAAAVLGDSFGYWFGRRVGPAIFSREDSLLFHKDHLRRAQEFYTQHGGKTIILARFMPIIRTFAPIVAGVGAMRYPSFLFYNLIGGLVWAVCIPLLGYYLGNAVPDIEKYIIPGVVIIIFLSILPPIIEVLKDSSQRTKIRSWLTK